MVTPKLKNERFVHLAATDRPQAMIQTKTRRGSDGRPPPPQLLLQRVEIDRLVGTLGSARYS